MAYLKISNVSKKYKDGENVFLALKNINLEFNINEFIAILGESGSGKSTLLNLITGISDITKGNIYINNENIKTFSNKRMNRYRKKEIGIIFQKYNLIDLYNLLDNLKLVIEKDINHKKIDDLLKRVGLLDKKNHRTNECSGGELQRIAAIRALINNPPILICDEPTGALDYENSEKLMNYLESIKKNRLIIFVTHNKDLAKKYASRIIELKDGEVIKDQKNISEDKEINDFSNSTLTNIRFIHKIKFILNLINKKKGRFLISFLSSVFLLFFMSISLMSINVISQYVNFSFLSSLDTNVLDLKSYALLDRELQECEVSSMIINELKDDKDFIVRKNFNYYLKDNLLNILEFKINNKIINLNGIELRCMSKYCDKELIIGEFSKNINEVIINENLYNYLENMNNSILNKRIYIKENNLFGDYLKIVGVSNSSFMDNSLIVYFDYEMINNLLNNIETHSYQIDIKNINEIDKVIKKLKNSNFYKEINEIKDDKINYSLEYSNSLDNYYTFYELINLAKIIVYFFLSLTLIISIMLLSNVIYSFNEEEKKNLALLKILGFSFWDIGSMSLILGLIISILSFISINIVNYYINIYFSPVISSLLDIDVKLKLLLKENIFLLICIIILSLLSCIFPLIKLKFIKLNNALKEE